MPTGHANRVALENDSPRGRRADGTFAKGHKGTRSTHKDGWGSALTGLGTNRDKRESAHFRRRTLSYFQLAELWEQDDIAAKAIEAPGAEAFRPGFEIEISDEGKYGDLKESLEDALEALGVEDILERAYCYMRAYGGAAVLLGINDGQTLDKPLVASRNAPLEYLDVYEPIEIIPFSLYQDPRKPKYGQVEYFQLNSFIGTISTSLSHTAPLPAKNRQQVASPVSTLIHESRLIVFQGIRVSRYLQSHNPVSPFWGAPVMPRWIEVLRDFEVGYSGAGLLATDVSQPVIAIEGLKEMIGKNEKKFRDRMAAIEMSRSIARAIVIDAAKERYERQTTNLAGIPDLLDRLSQRTAAAIGIPLSVLVGYSPASLGKPDDSEMKLWFNMTRKVQRRELGPKIKKIASIAMRSMRERKIPKHWRIKWGELEHMTTKDRVEAYRVMGQTDNLVVKAGMATSNELRKARYRGGYSFETTVDESKDAPGFIAPLPAGVLPKGMTPEAVATALEAGETVGGGAAAGAPVAGKPAMGAHSVSPYTRRDPRATKLVASPGAGATAAGDGGGAKKDGASADMKYTAANEAVRHQKWAARLRKNDDESSAQMADQLAKLAIAESMNCAAGTCGPDCVYDHSDDARQDDDRPIAYRQFAGLRIGIESDVGDTRSWTDSDGTTGTTTMKYPYGFVDGVQGADGDSVDCYLGPDEGAQWAYVVRQMSKLSGFADYDENKIMLGFTSPDAAHQAYVAQYDDPRFFGGMSMVSVKDLLPKAVA